MKANMFNLCQHQYSWLPASHSGECVPPCALCANMAIDCADFIVKTGRKQVLVYGSIPLFMRD